MLLHHHQSYEHHQQIQKDREIRDKAKAELAKTSFIMLRGWAWSTVLLVIFW